MAVLEAGLSGILPSQGPTQVLVSTLQPRAGGPVAQRPHGVRESSTLPLLGREGGRKCMDLLLLPLPVLDSEEGGVRKDPSSWAAGATALAQLMAEAGCAASLPSLPGCKRGSWQGLPSGLCGEGLTWGGAPISQLVLASQGENPRPSTRWLKCGLYLVS